MARAHRIGIVGTGFIARGFVLAAAAHPNFTLSRVLTRRDTQSCFEFPRPELLTNDVNELIDSSDLVLELSGDPVHATSVIHQAIQAGLPVVTMNSEFQVTAGSYFASQGLITEAEGDQPGCLAALRENCLAMGFEPMVYGNIKGFLNHNPNLEDMEFWAKKQGISLHQVTSFTDGTKIQIEQALVANAFGAGIATSGLLGIENDDLNAGARILADGAQVLGRPICDYVRSSNLPAGVFICASHAEEQRSYLNYLKLGDGPHYVMLQNWHLCHLEIAKTINRVLSGGAVLLNNSERPSISVAAVAKRRLAQGERISRGIGGFQVRGEAVRIRDHPDLIPIGLLIDAVLQCEVDPGQRLTFNDVAVPDSLALKAWLETRNRVLARGADGEIPGEEPGIVLR